MNFFFAILTKLRNEGTREVTFDKYSLAEAVELTDEEKILVLQRRLQAYEANKHK